MADGLRLRGLSTHGITLLSAASGLSIAAVDTITRPLMKDDRWPSRGRPLFYPRDAVALMCGMAAPAPSGCLELVQQVEDLRLMEGVHNEATVWTDALPGDHSLYGYLEVILQSLMKLSGDARIALADQAVKMEWSLDLCAAPCFAHIRWIERHAAEGLSRTFAQRMIWAPSTGPAAGWIPRPTGIMRITCIPFGVLAAAAEVCLESERRAALKSSSSTTPGGDTQALEPGLRDSADLENETAASLAGEAAALGDGRRQTGSRGSINDYSLAVVERNLNHISRSRARRSRQHGWSDFYDERGNGGAQCATA